MASAAGPLGAVPFLQQQRYKGADFRQTARRRAESRFFEEHDSHVPYGTRMSVNTTAYTAIALLAASAAPTPRHRDWISVSDYLLERQADGRTDNTAALQSAMDAAIASGSELYIPPGRYRYSRLSASLSGRARGLRIRGATTSDVSGTTGTILTCTARSSDCFTIFGNSGNANVIVEGVTFEGTPDAANGIVVNEGWNLKFIHSVFRQFSGAESAAVKITMSRGSFSGLVTFQGCEFESNTVGVWELPTPGHQINVIRYVDSRFLDSTEAAIKIGRPGLVMQGRSHSITHCDFEGNYRDIVVRGPVHAFSIDGTSYFENNTVGSPPRIQMDSAKSLSIQGYFQHDPGPGGSVILLNGVEGATIKRNFCSNGNGADRYFLTAISATNIEAEPPQTTAGNTSYPIRISSGSLADAVTYTSPVRWVGTGSSTVPRVSGSAIVVNAATAQSVRFFPPGPGDYTFKIPSNSSDQQMLTLWIVNTTPAALGTYTFEGGTGGYRLEAPWVNPAPGSRRQITFQYDASARTWYEWNRSRGDLRN